MQKLLGTLPPYLTLTGVVLSFLIPYLLFKINGKLHKLGDPPWKGKGKKT
ncbi:hypothetical protein [Brevibacillus brevis]|uniref:Uncharacterized protein n=1 Tax=Brevibacillus brevis TaxID=1393 RepID=A0ABY9T092_BREBE|nr:hypothetical protein [Brevibacillus brevis]WNC13507.1 hypothetical protein RGB73_22835 [Brevibacillus brevis]